MVFIGYMGVMSENGAYKGYGRNRVEMEFIGGMRLWM